APVGSQTNQVFTSQPIYYPPPAVYPQPPPKTRSPVGWILTFAGIGFLGILLFVAFLAARSWRRGPAFPPAPPNPPAIPAGVVTGETKRLFKLDPDATINVTNINGDVTIVGWDQPQAEVSVVKRGGSDRERADNAVDFRSDSDSLSVTARTGNFGTAAKLSLTLKVPREFDRLELKLNNGTISLSNFNADIEATVDNGSLVAEDISGSASMKVSNGSMRVHFNEVSEDTPLQFVAGKGNVQVRFDSLDNADLEAETGIGNIHIAPEFGIRAERHMMTSKASGRIGDGGRSVKITVGIGNIDIAK
ncbi:MAG TPA: DUF4097 family beta strand repeat-containing protein, partial [Blastocatellia bacterium]|nr:DUF4097 family beta strand repeat-containing protein [Blastocatellia bacterium]